MDEKQRVGITKKLKDYFEKRDDVVMAFLFGSFAKGQEIYDSDVDVAVYFKPKTKAIEWEEDNFYLEEDKIWRELENVLKRDVDLLILNRAPSRLASKILRAGIPIIIKDRSVYWRFFLLIGSVARDFQEFIRDYRRIRERSKSINKEDKERLGSLLDFLEDEMQSYEEFKDFTQLIYQSDRTQKRSVERWVENVVLSSVDMAEIVLASQKVRAPDKYREILKSLSFLNGFDKEIADKLGEFARLRNIITHEYLDIRWRQIQEFIKTSKPFYEYLIEFIKKNYLKHT